MSEKKTLRQQLLETPERKWDETLTAVRGVYVLPSRRKHDSGYSCMDFVAEFGNNKPMVRFGGCTDDVSLKGSNFRMDCVPPGIIHIWNPYYTFSVSHDLSSIDFTEEERA